MPPNNHLLTVRSNFWRSPGIEELAEAQGVRPIEDITALFGTWPGEIEDGFGESIHSLRRQSPAGSKSQ